MISSSFFRRIFRSFTLTGVNMCTHFTRFLCRHRVIFIDQWWLFFHTGNTYISGNGHVLNIDSVTTQEEGAYICVATNVLGRKEARSYVQVIGKSGNKTFFFYPIIDGSGFLLKRINYWMLISTLLVSTQTVKVSIAQDNFDKHVLNYVLSQQSHLALPPSHSEV